MIEIENYKGDFQELFTVEVDQVNRSLKIIGITDKKEYLLQKNEEYNLGSACGSFEKYYLLSQDELQNYCINVLYQSEEALILCHNEDVILIQNNKIYQISSHPYEPCLYIKYNNEIITTIHNFLTTSELILLANKNNKIEMINGKVYNIENICKFLSFAINNNISQADISYLEKQLIKDKDIVKKTEEETKKEETTCELKTVQDNQTMVEQVEDPFYSEYKKYPDCVLDYCIIKSSNKYNQEESHKEALIFAMKKWSIYLKDEYDIDIFYIPNKMKASKIEAKEFFELPSENENEFTNINKPYWYLFLKPPHGCNYNINDFIKINNILFPNGIDILDIYEWSVDWSNYFDDGLEWWGARCISIYDKTLNRFIIIGASATD